MSILASLSARIASIFHRSELRAEMDDELGSHIAHRADDLARSGMSRPEAERRARIEFGGREKYKEEIHAALRGNFTAIAVQDVRLALRGLRKSPGFTVAAVLTLALAIGANAVVFAVLNAFILRPLNVPHAGSLFGIFHSSATDAYESYPDYIDLRDRNRSFDSLAAFTMVQVGLDAGGNPSSVYTYETSGNYFDTLGIQPYLGQFFHSASEHGPNSAPYIVLTYDYWHSHFHDDRGVVGRVVRLNKHPFTILGVAPPGFNGTIVFFHPDMFMPLVDNGLFADNDMNARREPWIFMTAGPPEAGRHARAGHCRPQPDRGYLEKAYPKDQREPRLRWAAPASMATIWASR